MKKIRSSVPGLADLPSGSLLKVPSDFLKARRKADGAEGLWRINDKLYDLQTFVKFHPGGAEWIRLTQGTDITEIFMSHHLTDKASKLLPKYYIREAKSPRSVPWTFKEDGFFRTFQKRALEALKDVDFHHPSKKSNLIADFLVTTTFILCIATALMQSYLCVLLAGVFLSWTMIIGHNYFHMRDNFRMYYFDLGLMSSKDWRITHAMSHHIYPNTLWDCEISMAEPFLKWLPNSNKNCFSSFISQLISPIVWSQISIAQFVKRIYAKCYENYVFELRDAVPFILPLTMILFAPSFLSAIKMWYLIVVLSSFTFGLIGFNAAHHHPEIFHDGDIYRDDLDWGLLELDAVRERKVIDDVNFLTLTNFGQHGLHHLLPTVDHCYLSLCMDAFIETCKEFGVFAERMTQWELIKGQFQQLSRTEPKKNYRGSK